MKEAALKYLEEVQAEFQHDTIKLHAFKKMLKGYKDEKIDIGGIKVRVKGLFKDHTHLISGFNTFLPKEHQITPNLDHEDLSAFRKAVKDAFQDKRENFDEFCHIHYEWKYKRVDTKSILARMKELLKEHIDLYFGYEAFVSQSECSATTGNQFKGDDSKKKIMKREAENERSNTSSKKLKIKNNNNNDNDQLQEERPELPLEYKEKIEQMEGSDVMLVMQKKLTMTDVNDNNGRLSIPKTERITDKFLTSEEKSSLDYVRGKHEDCHTMDVSVLDPRSVFDPKVKPYDGMGFTKWKMVKSETYNITGKWNDLVAENQLKEGQKVQLWSFRRHRQLCFALVKL